MPTETVTDTSSTSPLLSGVLRVWKDVRDLELARMGGVALQDLALEAPEEIFDSAQSLGAQIRTELSDESGNLKPAYLALAHDLARRTPAARTPVHALTLIARVAATLAYFKLVIVNANQADQQAR